MEGRRLAVVLIVTSCLSALTVGDTVPGLSALTVDDDTVPDVCRQPLEVGPCKAAYPRYYYNHASDTCQLFYYGGCNGNENRFEDFSGCLFTCIYPWMAALGY
uniref:Conkunitzin n=1 Tax=Conus ermineus TaxID=55423 RepID=A0A346CIU8_CONER|nr:conkunitzin [Conus ermineus]